MSSHGFSEAGNLTRLLRRSGFQPQRSADHVLIDERSVRAFLLVNRVRPYIAVIDLISRKQGVGTRLVDALVTASKAMHLRGLAFTDQSDGHEQGEGFWRAYAAKRGLVYEREELRSVPTTEIASRFGAAAAAAAAEVAGGDIVIVESRIIVDPKVPHVPYSKPTTRHA